MSNEPKYDNPTERALSQVDAARIIIEALAPLEPDRRRLVLAAAAALHGFEDLARELLRPGGPR